jgi:murein DD-endopeptidase MepM/ murein hydrolase activator NlpD
VDGRDKPGHDGTRKYGFVAIAFIAFLLAVPAHADDRVALDGQFVQGGLVAGRTLPGARITLDGKRVRVGRDGVFLLGFGRDAAGIATLVAMLPDGARVEKAVSIARRAWDIQRIDGLPPAQVTPSPADLARIAEDSKRILHARSRDTDAADFARGFVWPALGRISGVYGSQRILNGEPRRPHLAVDVAAPVGTPVAAAADGTVAMAAAMMFFTGNTVILDHGHGLTTLYAHLDAITVKEGERVARGQPLGRLGGTGRVTGPHLHWGMNLFATALDPALVVPPMPNGQ